MRTCLLSSPAQDMTRADKEEAAAMQHYDLPPDPFHDQIEGQLNVPVLAFSYLLRRFTVSTSLLTSN